MTGWIMVIHGPDVFDSGTARQLIRSLRPPVVWSVGVMTRTASEESDLPVEWQPGRPSEVIARADGPVVLVTQGKTAETGRIFGEVVARRCGNRTGIVHIECTARRIFVWNGADRGIAARISLMTGFQVEEAAPQSLRRPDERLIRGCLPGEPVCVEGVVIGRAVSETVLLAREGATIRAVRGLDPKPHGLEKLAALPPFDLADAWCTSGSIRRSNPRMLRSAPQCGRVAVVDHRGLDLYGQVDGETCGLLAVGDDTTMVCGHICTHLGVPVFGITDGDCDRLVPASFPPGSVVVEVVGERDDDVGRWCVKARPLDDVCWDDWVRGTLAFLGDRARITLDLRAKGNGAARE
ncbi:MAG: DUF2117 domain-containing protein [Methanoculleaceae archaeon]